MNFNTYIRFAALCTIALLLQACPFGEEEVVPEPEMNLSVTEDRINYNTLEVSYSFKNLTTEQSTDYGICYSENGLATVSDSTKVPASLNGLLKIDGLKNDVEYSFRTYARSAEGVNYGNEVKQTTKGLAGSTWLLDYEAEGALYKDLEITFDVNNAATTITDPNIGIARFYFAIFNNNFFGMDIYYENGRIISHPGEILDDDIIVNFPDIPANSGLWKMTRME